MLRIAIAEDEQTYAAQLQQYLNTFRQEFRQELEVTCYPHGQALVEDFHSQFDLILLDIQMPHMDGMTTAQHIRAADQEVVILFITNMAQYAIRGYEVDALDYILKPITYFAFSQRLNRAIGRIHRRRKRYVVLTVKGGTKRVAAEDLYYVESQGHNLIFHTAAGAETVFGTMKDVEEKLASAHFFRCNKGYLVNLAHVDGIMDGCALVAGKSLVISRPRKAEFLEALTNYMSGVRL